MIELIKDKLVDIKILCKEHHVKNLSLFGSAAKGLFNNNSDVDFVVEFKTDISPLDYADNFFSLLNALKKLLNKKVDLLSARALKNKVIINEINNSKVMLYAA